MGDIAEAMIEGVLCQVCGEYLGEGAGFPVTCEACGGDEIGADNLIGKYASPPARSIKCGHKGCLRGFRTEQARLDHRRDKHGITT